MKAAIERSEAAWKEVREKRGIWENPEVPAGVPTAPSKDATKDSPVVVDSADPQATKYTEEEFAAQPVDDDSTDDELVGAQPEDVRSAV